MIRLFQITIELFDLRLNKISYLEESMTSHLFFSGFLILYSLDWRFVKHEQKYAYSQETFFPGDEEPTESFASSPLLPLFHHEYLCQTHQIEIDSLLSSKVLAPPKIKTGDLLTRMESLKEGFLNLKFQT